MDYATDTCEYLFVHEEIVQKVKKEMPDENRLYALSDIFRVFGDKTRIKILYTLFFSEMCVCDIAALTDMTQSAISHQLAVLKQNKLVKSERRGKSVFYSLTDDHVKTIINQGMEHADEK